MILLSHLVFRYEDCFKGGRRVLMCLCLPLISSLAWTSFFHYHFFLKRGKMLDIFMIFNVLLSSSGMLRVLKCSTVFSVAHRIALKLYIRIYFTLCLSCDLHYVNTLTFMLTHYKDTNEGEYL